EGGRGGVRNAGAPRDRHTGGGRGGGGGGGDDAGGGGAAGALDDADDAGATGPAGPSDPADQAAGRRRAGAPLARLRDDVQRARSALDSARGAAQELPVDRAL